MILPLTFFFATCVGAGNLALIYSSAGFVEMIACSGPLCVMIVGIGLGLKIDSVVAWPVLIVSCGMALCIRGEIAFSMSGTMLAAYATFASAMKSALQNKVLSKTEEGELKMEPIELLAWMSPASIIFMFVWSIATEGAAPWVAVSGTFRPMLIAGILLSCLNA